MFGQSDHSVEGWIILNFLVTMKHEAARITVQIHEYTSPEWLEKIQMKVQMLLCYQDIYEGTGETVQRLRALVALGEVLGLVSSTHIGLVSICNSNSKRSGTSSLKSVYTVKNQSCWCQALEWWELIRYWMCRCWDFKHKLKHLKQLVTRLSTDMPHNTSH